jgi:hypothetical protein
MSLDINELSQTMLNAFKGQLQANWPQIKHYAEAEAKKLAENLVLIEKLHLLGDMSDEQAALQHKLQKNAARVVLISVQGMSLLMAEQAVNAALDSVKTSVNTALNFTLL